jgi:hypothetical protein
MKNDTTIERATEGPEVPSQHTPAAQMSFREEMETLPAFQRSAVYASAALLALIVVQGVLILPYILIRFGWGYNVG